METLLLNTEALELDPGWLRAAIRECIAYGEHGLLVEADMTGQRVCFNCRGQL